jgi:predicted glycosyltransferase
MALIEDMFKGNLAAGLAIGVGAIILGPTAIRTLAGVLRPAAKTMIKSGMVFYRETLSEIGEMATDLVAEARAELDQEAGADRQVLAKTGSGAAQQHHATA